MQGQHVGYMAIPPKLRLRLRGGEHWYLDAWFRSQEAHFRQYGITDDELKWEPLFLRKRAEAEAAEHQA
jgi:hypothetical protein